MRYVCLAWWLGSDVEESRRNSCTRNSHIRENVVPRKSLHNTTLAATAPTIELRETIGKTLDFFLHEALREREAQA